MIVCDGTVSVPKNSSYSIGTYPGNTPYKSSTGSSLKNLPMYQASGLISFSSASNARSCEA